MKLSPISFQARALISTEFKKEDRQYINLKAKSFDNNKKQNTIVVSSIEKMDDIYKDYITILKLDYFEKTKHIACATIKILTEEMNLPNKSRKNKINKVFEKLTENLNNNS